MDKQPCLIRVTELNRVLQILASACQQLIQLWESHLSGKAFYSFYLPTATDQRDQRWTNRVHMNTEPTLKRLLSSTVCIRSTVVCLSSQPGYSLRTVGWSDGGYYYLTLRLYGILKFQKSHQNFAYRNREALFGDFGSRLGTDVPISGS
jgi:hypothetical protein